MLNATKRSKSQYEVHYILGYTKMTKLTKLYSIEMCTIHYIICQILSFLCRLEYKVFHIEILTGL
jgi:hypothetical protein